MKKLRATMDRYSEKLNEQWKSLSTEKQRKYTLYAFAVYLLLTAGVILKVCYDTSKSGNRMVIEHIENPVRKK